MFFNSKRFEVVDLTNQTFLELNKTNTLSFYIKDILLNTTIDSLYYQVVKKTGRDEVLVGSYVQIEDITGDIALFHYVPTDTTLPQLSFRIKALDTDGIEHLLNIDTYNVKS